MNTKSTRPSDQSDGRPAFDHRDMFKRHDLDQQSTHWSGDHVKPTVQHLVKPLDIFE